MALLQVSNNIKTGKQELLIAGAGVPDTVDKCGSTVEAITANDFNIKLSDGSFVPLKDYIIQQAITISNMTAVIQANNDVVITWVGNQNVNITYSGTTIPSTGTNSVTVQNVPVGSHVFKVQAVDDLRGLEKTVVIELPSGSGLTITYGGN